jgi:hypothetical protein
MLQAVRNHYGCEGGGDCDRAYDHVFRAANTTTSSQSLSYPRLQICIARYGASLKIYKIYAQEMVLAIVPHSQGLIVFKTESPRNFIFAIHFM